MALQHVPVRHEIAEQRVRLRLIGALCVRAVGIVLQARAGAALLRQDDRVIEAERHAVAEPTQERQLERVRGEPAPRHVLRDAAVAAERAHLVGRHGRCAGRRARERRILIGRRIRRAEVDGVDVDAFEDVVRMLADVLHVDRHRPGQRHLDASVPLPGRGKTA